MNCDLGYDGGTGRDHMRKYLHSYALPVHHVDANITKSFIFRCNCTDTFVTWFMPEDTIVHENGDKDVVYKCNYCKDGFVCQYNTVRGTISINADVYKRVPLSFHDRDELYNALDDMYYGNLMPSTYEMRIHLDTIYHMNYGCHGLEEVYRGGSYV